MTITHYTTDEIDVGDVETDVRDVETDENMFACLSHFLNLTAGSQSPFFVQVTINGDEIDVGDVETDVRDVETGER